MSQENKHTKLPWKVSGEYSTNGVSDLYQIHWSEHGECVAEIVHGKEDAAFIVKAVNNHEKLLQRLKDDIADLKGIAAVVKTKLPNQAEYINLIIAKQLALVSEIEGK